MTSWLATGNTNNLPIMINMDVASWMIVNDITHLPQDLISSIDSDVIKMCKDLVQRMVCKIPADRLPIEQVCLEMIQVQTMLGE